MRAGSNVRKRVFLAIFLMLLIAVAGGTALAAPIVKKVTYKGKGRVEVSFRRKVSYQDLKLTVRNRNGKEIRAEIVKTEPDEVNFRIIGYRYAKTYSWRLEGIKENGSESVRNARGIVYIPGAPGGIPIKEVDYDTRDHELEVHFDVPVQWHNIRVSVTDGKKQYVTGFSKRGQEELEITVKPMRVGRIYHITIGGIRKKGTKAYKEISFAFRPKKD